MRHVIRCHFTEHVRVELWRMIQRVQDWTGLDWNDGSGLDWMGE